MYSEYLFRFELFGFVLRFLSRFTSPFLDFLMGFDFVHFEFGLLE